MFFETVKGPASPTRATKLDALRMKKYYGYFIKQNRTKPLEWLLRPDDGLLVPALLFHPVENGRLAGSSSSCSIGVGDLHHNIRIDGEEGDDGPSLSVNIFVLSPFLSTAQELFQKSRRPLGSAGRQQRPIGVGL